MLGRGIDATQMAPVSIKNAAPDGLQVAALGNGLTCGRTRATLGEK